MKVHNRTVVMNLSFNKPVPEQNHCLQGSDMVLLMCEDMMKSFHEEVGGLVLKKCNLL